MRLKELSKNLLLLFITVVIFLFFLELGLRIFYPEGRMTFQFSKESDVIIRIPNIEFKTRTKEFGLLTHKTNSSGFLDSEHNYKKEENVYRIIVLGDSWVEADQVPLDKTFHKILEAKLNELKTNKKFEVMSFGVSSFNTAEEYLVLKEIGLKYNPDLVVLLVYAGNDIVHNSLELGNEPTKPFFDLENGIIKQVQWPSAPSKNKLVAFANKYFRIPRFLYKKIKLVKYQYDSFKSKFEGGEEEPIVESVSDYDVYRKEYDEQWEKAWQITEALIEEMKKTSQQNGADFLLMNIPAQWEAEPSLWNEALINYPSLKKIEWDLEKPNRILRELSRDNDIYYLDLLLAFREYLSEAEEEIYQGHFNSNGHKLTAELMYNFLIDKKLIKSHL